MTRTGFLTLAALLALLPCMPVLASDSAPVAVTLDNFIRAESDLYFSKFVGSGGDGKFAHERQPVAVEKQDIIRSNRDTLYSYAVVDVASGPVGVAIPESNGRFLSMQVINQDHYTVEVLYDPGQYTFDQKDIGTDYALFLVRTFVDPNDPEDLARVHEMQDRLSLSNVPGTEFHVPAWDRQQAQRLREALNELAAANGGIDSGRMFGAKDVVDPLQHLIGTAAGWGGNPAADAYYEGFTPERNDGSTVHRLSVKDVPVEGFWSISVYNADGFFEPSEYGLNSLNNVTAHKESDGSVSVQFGGCGESTVNCLAIVDGWNYLVRLYRPKKAILEGNWVFPRATPAP